MAANLITDMSIEREDGTKREELNTTGVERNALRCLETYMRVGLKTKKSKNLTV